MRRQTHDYLNNLPPSVLVEIIQSLCRHSATDVHHGPDPGDGKPIVYGADASGTFTLATVPPNIDMVKRKAYIFRIEGDLAGVCDSLGDLIFCDSFELIGVEDVKPKDNGCGCLQEPPCMGCAKTT